MNTNLKEIHHDGTKKLTMNNRCYNKSSSSTSSLTLMKVFTILFFFHTAVVVVQAGKNNKHHKHNKHINNHDDKNGRSVVTTGHTFFWLSDMHWDPFYGTENAAEHVDDSSCISPDAPIYGQIGCDSPEVLIDESLQKLVDIIDSPTQTTPDFLIITGDTVRHENDQLNNPKDDTQTILVNMSQKLQEKFPHMSIIPCIGNNDVTPDYYLDVQKPEKLLSMVTTGFQGLFQAVEEQDSFSKGGYLARQVSDHLTVISLNTVIYSVKHTPRTHKKNKDDPLGQFAWLTEQLDVINSKNNNNDDASVSQHRVYIAGHIPPVLGSFRHAQLWDDQYLQTYYDILSKYRSLIAGQLYGHLHSDEFRLIEQSVVTSDEVEEKYAWPVFLSSSVTPIYGSNPSVRVVHYHGETSEIVDYDTYYLDLDEANNNNNNTNKNNDDDGTTWTKSQSFTQSFDVADMSPTSLKGLVNQLEEERNKKLKDPSYSSGLWQTLLDRQHIYSHAGSRGSGGHSTCDANCQQQWLCSIQSISSSEYNNCLGQSIEEEDQSRRHLGKKISIGMFVTMVTIIALLFVRQKWKRRFYESPPEEAGNMTTTEAGDSSLQQQQQQQREEHEGDQAGASQIDSKIMENEHAKQKPLPQIS